jgi:hypothetical protein
MKRGWLLLLLLSVGLNIGLGYAVLSRRTAEEEAGTVPAWRERPPAFATEDTAAFRRFMESRFSRLARRLDLSPEVKEELWQSRLAVGPHIMAQQRAVREARQRLHAAFSADPAAPDSVSLRLRELGRAQAALDYLVSASLLHEMMLLPPEQRRLYLDFMPWERHGRPEHERGGPPHGSRRPGGRRDRP